MLSAIYRVSKAVKKCRNALENRNIVALLALFSISVVIFLMTGLLYVRNEVLIKDGLEETRVFTALELPDEILDEQGFELSEGDYYDFSGFEDNKAYLTIFRAESYESTNELTAAETSRAPEEHTVDVSISVDGRTIDSSVNTSYLPVTRTVEVLLKSNKVTFGRDDIITPPLDETIDENTEIIVQRVEYAERISTEAIPYQTEYIESTLKTIGYSKTITEGVNGTHRAVIRDKIVDGEVISSEIISSEIIEEPVTEITEIGTALATPYSKREFDEITLVDGKPIDYQYIISGKSCAYTAGPNAGTASGRKLQIGTVAVDPKIIPYGSLLYIVSKDGKHVYGAAVAADTGYFTDVVVDLYMGLTSENYDDACRWGAKTVDIYVINTGKY